MTGELFGCTSYVRARAIIHQSKKKKKKKKKKQNKTNKGEEGTRRGDKGWEGDGKGMGRGWEGNRKGYQTRNKTELGDAEVCSQTRLPALLSNDS